MINVVTSFSPDGYKTYAKNMLLSVIKNWKNDLKLTAYYHDFPEDLVKDLPKSPLIEYRNLNDIKDMLDYRERMKQYDGTMGGKTPYNWRLDAIKWCHKVYAMTDCAFRLADSKKKAGWLVWLDADTVTTKPLSQDRLTPFLPDKAELAYLGRKDVDYSETSFIGFNLDKESPLLLLGDLRGCYDIGEVISYREWHDGFIFDRLLKIYMAHGLLVNNLTPNVSGLAAFQQSPLAQYMTHYKGNLKNPIPDSVAPDVMLPRYKQLATLVRTYAKNNIVEVGTWNGGRAIEMSLAAFEKHKKVHYVGFDLFEEATEESDKVELNSKRHNTFTSVKNRLSEFAEKMKAQGKTFTFELYKGDSKKTLQKAEKSLQNISFAYIDGGHSEETVRSDYKYLKHSPIVVFDDYFSKDIDGNILGEEHQGTNRLFEELKANKKAKQTCIVLPSNDRVQGGGVTHLAVFIQDTSLPPLPKEVLRVPILVRPKDCMPKDYIINNINENIKLIKKWGIARNCNPNSEHAIIVSAGPSVDYDELRRVIKETNGVVLSVKHSYPHLLKEKIPQWGCIILDPRTIDGVSTHGVVRKELFAKVDKKTNFFVASMTDPSVTKYLMERTDNVHGWHAYSEAVREASKDPRIFAIDSKAKLSNDTTFVTGGTCAAMRGVGLMHILGFRNFHLFGFDCNIPKMTAKMKEEKLDNKPKYMPVETNNKKFWTTGELLAMAQDCERLFNNAQVDANIQVYGRNTLVHEVFKNSHHAKLPHYLDYFNGLS